jgi:hypothetical protein
VFRRPTARFFLLFVYFPLVFFSFAILHNPDTQPTHADLSILYIPISHPVLYQGFIIHDVLRFPPLRLLWGLGLGKKRRESD